jgi:predicted phosphodiesterase
MSYERFLAVGCSHGMHLDPKARDAVIKFRESYKPKHTIHLGDFIDTKALRSGAVGTQDESEPIRPDIESGLEFLTNLRPTIVLCGNHEDRPWRLRGHHNAVISELATMLVSEIESTCRRLKASLHPWSANWQGVIIHGWRFMHGTMFSENATRDHAEAYGNTIHAHTHRPALAKGRRIDNPTGVCVGTLTRIRELDYAKARRSTLSWGQAFAWGELHPTKGAFVNLCLGPQEGQEGEWRLP